MKAYFDSDLKFPLIKLLINFVLNAIWFKHFVSFTSVLVLLCAITSLHLKYSFQQIKDKVRECVKSGNSHQLIDAIHEHNYCSEETKKVIYLTSRLLFIAYFPTTISSNILIYRSTQTTLLRE